MNKAKITLLIAVLFISIHSFSQGCNDAGLCTLADFGNSNNENKSKYHTELVYTLGLGEQQVIVQTLQMDQRISIFQNKAQIVLRLPFHYSIGNLAQTYGIGDISLGLNYNFPTKKKYRFSAFLGGKLPVNDANIEKDGKGLPMVYQTSLGTYDFMAGVNFMLKKWQFGIGYQLPFGENNNTFTYSAWEGNEDALQYYESAYLKRAADVIGRADKLFNFKKNSLKAGLVGIYRVEPDRITIDGVTSYPEDSKGLTLNASVVYEISMTNNDRIQLSLAAPLITREYRTDGLTRTFVLGFGYVFGQRKNSILKNVKIGNVD